MKTAIERYEAGDLDGAIAAMNDEVRGNPTDHARRSFLCELLCFAGEFERADKQLDIMLTQIPEDAPGVILLRQLIRAELHRQAFHAEGRIPEVLHDPDEVVRESIAIAVELQAGRSSGAAEAVARRDAAVSAVTGRHDGNPFTEFRDLDDVSAGVIETLTSTGKFYWIPVSQVRSIRFEAPARPFDLIWRRAHMDVAQGPDGEVYIPTRYPSRGEEIDAVRLGRHTEWTDTTPVLGAGQRMFLVGDEAVPILALGSLEFEAGARE